MPDPIVEPLPQTAPVAPQPPPAEPTPSDQDQQPPPASEAALPPALTQIPSMQGLLAGAPPAVSMDLKGTEDRKEVKLIADNKGVLTQAGFGFYRSLDGKKGVMFNALHVHPQDLQAADRQGKLLQVAPDWDLVNHAIAKMGLNHPIHSMQAPPAGFAPPTPQAPPQAASGMLPLMPPPPASVGNKMASARIANIQPGAPTSGPSPGAGRLLNSVLRGVV